MTSEHRPPSSRIADLLPPHPDAPVTPARPGPADPAGQTRGAPAGTPAARPARGDTARPATAIASGAPGATRPATTDISRAPGAPRPATADTSGASVPARPATAGTAGASARPATTGADPLTVETTARLRPVRSTAPAPPQGRPGPAHPAPGPAHPAPAPPQAPPSRPSAAPPTPVRSARPASGPLAPPQAPPPRPSAAPSVPPQGRPGPAHPAPAPPQAARAQAARTHFTPSYARAVVPPEAPVEITTRLRPVRDRRSAGRTAVVAACAVLGFGLIGGALAGVWLAASEPGKPAEPAGYAEARELWHNAPVDALFPRTLAGPGAGPGSAARTWTRIVVAPDAACSPAVLAEGLLATVEPLGCERVLRATYTDATASSVITVGLVFTRADAAAQRTLGQGLTARLGQDVPPALSGPSTVAARFGDRQRASWWTSAPADLPVVVTAVSGFADGRTVDAPQPADRAMAKGRTDAVAQSGLGHEAKGITEHLERLLRTTATAAAKEKAR
ncbi:hypothetical protein ACFY40_19560 [Streptomyces sp. NPDC012950]|uniref:hypothetical protein n=1 Tax=Streptomyces sp. NPDC012950 TaxID=3364858 RepID=UPI003690B622